MNKHLLLTLAACAALAGCAASVTPRFDAKFGSAVRDARQRMALNPAPSTADIASMDGTAAREAQMRYHDSFKAPPPVVNVINIGGGVGGGK